MTRIGLVACSASKQQRPAPARQMYLSPLFQKSAAYAEASCDRWYVLSARHGLVAPDEVIAPYDARLLARGAMGWGVMVRYELEVALEGLEDPVLVLLAGETYRTPLLVGLHWPVEIPMQGLAIGQQLAWLNDQLAASLATC